MRPREPIHDSLPVISDAEALGLTIRQTVVMRADQVVE